jgi:hypothetical protein
MAAKKFTIRSVDDVKEVLAAMKEAQKRNDPEVGHALEASLYENIVRLVASGKLLTVREYSEIAKEALKARRIQFKW